ncbi:MAG: hypothetical protein IJ551_09880 [Prevotella sp.]|nr:hypothetical protein [Prevotella sp.]
METIRTTRQASDSHWFVIEGKEYFLPWNWENKVNLQTMQYVKSHTDEWKTCDWPTLNQLRGSGVDVRNGFPYREYDINLPDVRVLTPEKAHDIVEEFKANGFNVTLDAIMHNYAAWNADFKSGYRGEDFHLFTPCGCNPLSFRATTLEPSCEDWQTTYMC